MMTTSYWLDGGARSTHADPTSNRVDVNVIGAGVTGCACALALAERGLRVRVHEARHVAAGASGRNGGFALRGGAMPYDRAREQLGPDRARALWRLTESTLERMESLAGDAFAHVGSLRLAVDETEREALTSELDALRSDGFDGAWAERLPKGLGERYCGALLHPRDGSLHPARWVRQLAEHAARAGAEIVEGRRAVPDALDTPVVVAVDGGLAALLPELAPHVVPVRGQMLATEPLRERLFTRPHYARWGYDYWQQLSDGRLVVGGKRDVDLVGEQTEVDETTAAVQSAIESLVVDLVGRLPAVTHRWSGVWGQTPDLLPLVGEVRDGVWVAGGYSGHGNVLGLACGELVARAVAGDQAPELDLFDPGRFG
ncbi:MAG: FAD-binding oxidoreductase [Actinobacteria bacterium]|nr:FAD-binding oxidoreductase [Actinomycetota bacterium]